MCGTVSILTSSLTCLSVVSVLRASCCILVLHVRRNPTVLQTSFRWLVILLVSLRLRSLALSRTLLICPFSVLKLEYPQCTVFATTGKMISLALVYGAPGKLVNLANMRNARVYRTLRLPLAC